MFKMVFFLGLNSNKPQEQEVHPKSWQNGIFLRCSCISKLGPSRHAVKHRSCGATSVNGKAYIISSCTYRTEGSSHSSRRIEEKNLCIHPSIPLNDFIRELERICFIFVPSWDMYGPFSMRNAIFWNQRAYSLTLQSLLPLL